MQNGNKIEVTFDEKNKETHIIDVKNSSTEQDRIKLQSEEN